MTSRPRKAAVGASAVSLGTRTERNLPAQVLRTRGAAWCVGLLAATLLVDCRFGYELDQASGGGSAATVVGRTGDGLAGQPGDGAAATGGVADPFNVAGDGNPGGGNSGAIGGGSPGAGAGALGGANVACGADTDADGVCDAVDRCPGFDDAADADGDGVPDGCDRPLHDGQCGATPTVVQDGAFGTAVNLQGIVVPSVSGEPGWTCSAAVPELTKYPFTLSIWFRTSPKVASNGGFLALCPSTGCTFDTRFALNAMYQFSDVRPHAYTLGNFYVLDGSGGNDDGKWHHSVGVWSNDTQYSLYVDGAWIGDQTGPFPFPTGDKVLVLGGAAVGYELDDATLFDARLTAPEIAELHQTGSVAGVVPLVHWRLDDVRTSIIPDSP